MSKYHYILLIFLMAVNVSGQEIDRPSDTVQSSPGISIESSVDRAEIFIGDLISYKITITYDSTIELTPPPIGANLGGFDVKEYDFDEPIKLDDGRIKLESRFRLTTFTTGDYIIPPIPIEFVEVDSTRKILMSEPMPIRVKSLLAEGEDSLEARPGKGPIAFDKKLSSLTIIIIVLSVLIIVALFIGWWRLRNKPKDTEPIDTRPPWEIAFEKLAILKEKNYLTAGEYKLYYVELSEIVRDFLQRIYQIPVLDMTTYEFLCVIKEKDIPETMFDRFKNFLDFADLVKFAKLKPESDRMEDDYIEAWSVIDEIRQQKISPVAVGVDHVNADESVEAEKDNV